MNEDNDNEEGLGFRDKIDWEAITDNINEQGLTEDLEYMTQKLKKTEDKGDKVALKKNLEQATKGLKAIKKFKNEKDKKFVSYFQSVITFAVITNGKDVKEAQEKAQESFKNADSKPIVTAFEQTPYELTDTKEMQK